MEKLDDKKDFSFPYLCLIERVEKWRDRKLFCLVEMKNKRTKNRVFIIYSHVPIKNKTKSNTLYTLKIVYRWALH